MNEIERLRAALRATTKASCAAEVGQIVDAALSQQAEPAPSKYSDVVSDGGMDPRNVPPPAQDKQQPAGVVLPPQCTDKSKHVKYRKGWNSCLSEVFRLNRAQTAQRGETK